MKNWIISLAILILPIAGYMVLKGKQVNDVLPAASAVGKPTIIKFASPMCLDCKKMEEVLVIVRPKYSDKVNFVEIDATNTDANVRDSVQKYNVRVVPTLIFIDKNGNKVRKTEGYLPKNTLEKHIKELIK